MIRCKKIEQMDYVLEYDWTRTQLVVEAGNDNDARESKGHLPGSYYLEAL